MRPRASSTCCSRATTARSTFPATSPVSPYRSTLPTGTLKSGAYWLLTFHRSQAPTRNQSLLTKRTRFQSILRSVTRLAGSALSPLNASNSTEIDEYNSIVQDCAAISARRRRLHSVFNEEENGVSLRCLVCTQNAHFTDDLARLVQIRYASTLRLLTPTSRPEDGSFSTR